MLARLSVSKAVHLSRGTSSSLPRLASWARYNSSEAAAPAEAAAPDAEDAPKKRAIPIADSLGDITITNRPKEAGGQRRNGDRANGNGNGNGNRNGNRDPSRPRQNYNNNREGNSNGDGNGNGNRNGNRNGPDNRANAGSRRPNNGTDSRPPRQDRPGYQQSAQSQGRPRREGDQNRRDDRRPRRARAEGEGEDGAEVVLPVIPPPRKIEYTSNLEDLFGPATPAPAGPRVPSTTTTTTTSADGTKPASTSQARVQSLLERTAGDYSRYVARVLPTTDVSALSPRDLAAFVLSKQGDVTLPRREHALAVVGKFPETKEVRQGAAPA
ncbi:hypothetical protein C2E23DRAFT_888406 [Lenzites betulinus]|nr:hypothetical protein C2E23DRAFT_888406 [Lenzites betulinus]